MTMAPLWTPHLLAKGAQIELGFRDLIWRRSIVAFIAEDMTLQTIRACLDTARELVKSDRTFSTKCVETDGRRIFPETMDRAATTTNTAALLDLKDRSYVLTGIVERTFRDLDFAADIMAQ
jgi:hypothetical protein